VYLILQCDTKSRFEDASDDARKKLGGTRAAYDKKEKMLHAKQVKHNYGKYSHNESR